MENVTNASTQVMYTFTGFHSFYHSFLILLALLIAFVNSYVLYLFLNTYTLRIGLTNRLLANMAFSDILTGAITIPFTIISASLRGRTIANFHLLYFSSNVLSDFCTIYAASSIFLIMLDRYLLVCRPFCSLLNTLRIPTMRQILIKCLVIMSIAILPITWSYDLLLNPDQPMQNYYFMAEKIYVVTITLVFFFIPSCIIFIVLLMMYRDLKKTIYEENDNNITSFNGIQNGVVLRYLIAFTAFMICWLPLMTIRTLDYFTTELARHLSEEFLEAMFTLRCTTSLFNPLVYTWSDRDYKKIILKSYLYRKLAMLMQCRIPKEENIEMV